MSILGIVASSAAGSFTWPSGLVVRSAADAIVATDGDALTGWADLSGNGHHWSVSGSPKYRAGAGPNSLHAVEAGVGGGDGYFIAAGGVLSALSSGATGADAFLVIKAAGEVGNAGMWYFSTNGQSGHYRYSNLDNIYENFGAENRINNSPPDNLTQWKLYNCSSKTGEQYCRLDGVTRITGAGNYSMGSGFLGTGNGFTSIDFRFAEIAIFNRVLNGTERDLVEGYFATKYALSIS